jgi:hypothetical protein
LLGVIDEIGTHSAQRYHSRSAGNPREGFNIMNRSEIVSMAGKRVFALALITLAGALPARADFSGAYAPAAWTLYPTVSDIAAKITQH